MRRRRAPTAAAEPPKRSIFALVGQAAAVVGLVSAVVSLVFVFRPGCKPEPPPARQAAAITDVRVERPISYRQWLQRLNLPEGTLSDEFLSRRGVLVEFHYAVEGFKGKELPLRWELIDETTGDEVAEDPAFSIEPAAATEERDWSVWAELPRTKRSYHLVVTLYEPGGRVPLRRFPSASFLGLAAVGNG